MKSCWKNEAAIQTRSAGCIPIRYRRVSDFRMLQILFSSWNFCCKCLWRLKNNKTHKEFILSEHYPFDELNHHRYWRKSVNDTISVSYNAYILYILIFIKPNIDCWSWVVSCNIQCNCEVQLRCLTLYFIYIMLM